MSVVEQVCVENEVKTSTWRNLLFMKDGRTVLGAHVFSTEEQAAEAAKEGAIYLASLVALNSRFRIITKAGKHLYYCCEYSHSIQIPVTA